VLVPLPHLLVLVLVLLLVLPHSEVPQPLLRPPY
jgi:hypothetical protein